MTLEQGQEFLRNNIFATHRCIKRYKNMIPVDWSVKIEHLYPHTSKRRVIYYSDNQIHWITIEEIEIKDYFEVMS